MELGKIPLLLLAASLGMSTAQASTYFLDDGTGESGLGGFGSTNLWMNSFTSTAGMETITTVSVNFGDVSNFNQDGNSVVARIYSDPNDDGNPIDAVLEASVAGVVSASNTDTYIDFALAGGIVIPAGEVFFAAVSLLNGVSSNQNNFGPARDTNTSEGRSWIAVWGQAQTLDFGDLSTAFSVRNYNDVFSPNGGNATIRAIGIPEPVTGGLLGFATATFLLLRRRRR